MIVALSRFRVRNGFDAEVQAAFLARPRLVDAVPGFLGLETCTDAADGSLFYLVTRWTDRRAFEAWHGSAAHHQAHTGIPKGLKLDPTFTQVTVMQRIGAPDGVPTMEELTADASPVLARYLAATEALHLLAADLDGTIRTCNRAVTARQGQPATALVGTSLWSLLAASDAARLQQQVRDGIRDPGACMVLTFVAGRARMYTLACRLDLQPHGFLLLGEDANPSQDDHVPRSVPVPQDVGTPDVESARLSALVTMQRAFAESGPDRNAVEQRVVQDIQLLTRANLALVAVANGHRYAVRAVSAARGMEDRSTDKQRADAGLFGWCLRTGQTLACADTETDDRIAGEEARAWGVRSLICAPVRCQTTEVGLLAVLSRTPHAFTEQDSHTLELTTALLSATMVWPGDANGP